MIRLVLSHYVATTIGFVIGFFAAALLSVGKEEDDG